MEQPSWNPKDFAPSIYQEDDKLGQIYQSIAQQIIEKQLNKVDLRMERNYFNFSPFLLHLFVMMLELYLVT